MTPEQFDLLLKLLDQVVGSLGNKPYTLTGAADWPILAAMGGLILALIAVMWRDLKATIRDKDSDIKKELDKETQERKRQDDLIWAAMRDCKNECVAERRETR